MKGNPICSAGLACLLFMFWPAGCQTGPDGGSSGNGTIKTRGVYTTLAMPEVGLDLPASGYVQKNSFAPGENPEAIVAGYGDYNRPQLVKLELVELTTGRTLLSHDGYADYGKALIVPLAIRLSGNYKVSLLVNGTELDAYRFVVTRTNRSGAPQSVEPYAGAAYAKGIFSVGMESIRSSGLFDRYDNKLNYVILNAVSKEAESSHDNLFAQRVPGKVVIQCRLDSTGHIIGPKILENTIDDECGELFQKALLNRSPYAAWPEDAHRQLGSDFRDLKLTFRYD